MTIVSCSERLQRVEFFKPKCNTEHPWIYSCLLDFLPHLLCFPFSFDHKGFPHIRSTLNKKSHGIKVGGGGNLWVSKEQISSGNKRTIATKVSSHLQNNMIQLAMAMKSSLKNYTEYICFYSCVSLFF